MLTNLVANAVQYGGRYGPVSFAANQQDEDVVLTVHNEGPPIAADAIDKIFEPMVRQPVEVDDNSRGLGLGLYIAREVVAAHGGTLLVSSSKSEGTTFTVRIPRHRPGTQASVEGE